MSGKQAFGKALPRAVMLGQSFTDYTDMSFEQEASMYADTGRKLLNLGYQVFWKEFPRHRRSFYPVLLERLGGRLSQLRLAPQWPVEALAGTFLFEVCISGTTTALFNLKKLCHTACYSIA